MAELPHQCEECGEDGTIYLSPRCHPGWPVFAALTGDVLSMECAQCRQIVTRIKVTVMDLETEEGETTKEEGNG